MNNNVILKKIIDITKLKEENIKNIYMYGSRVYKTTHWNSDYDVICVIDNSLNDLNHKEIRNGDLNIHLITIDNFQNNLNEHKITEMECHFLENNFILKSNYNFNFNLDLIKLRKSISSKSSNSWVKAKKKFEIKEEDNFIGIKSMFHSLRILNFGIQISKNNKIIDYSSLKDIWEKMFTYYQQNKDYDFFNNEYKKLYNSFKTEFKIVVPKQ